MYGKRFRISYRDEDNNDRLVVGRLDLFITSAVTVVWEEKKESVHVFPTSKIRYMELCSNQNYQTSLATGENRKS